jgi:hypothetical protein
MKRICAIQTSNEEKSEGTCFVPGNLIRQIDKSTPFFSNTDRTRHKSERIHPLEATRDQFR